MLMLIHVKIYITIIHNQKDYNGKRIINSFVVSAKLWNTLKCCPKIFFNNEIILAHLLPFFFHPYQEKITPCYHSNLVSCGPDNRWNFKTDWVIKYFKLGNAIQRGHAIDIKRKRGKVSFLSHNLAADFLTLNICFLTWTSKVSKTRFTRILIGFLEFQLIRINIIAIIFNFAVMKIYGTFAGPSFLF